jgi:hypothetical protein
MQKLNSMDFEYPYPLVTVWLRILKKTRCFHCNFEGFGGIFKMPDFFWIGDSY